ncbi:MAG: Major Facilitator Superfamily transporter [Herbinix sp.]|nr:Major Facilitator Superfamily transporter [Herbinix sp.]
MNKNWKKNILLFMTSQTISLFGSSLVQYAIMWYITLRTQSGVMMTISIICGFLPTFFLAPFAGVWADRYNRKILIMLSDSMIALSTLVVAIMFTTGFDEIWLLFVVSAVRALGQGIQTPAVSAILPQIVPEEKLTKVSGINGSIQSIVLLVSPMLSGALLTVASIHVIFYIDVITAVIAVVVLLLFLHIPSHKKAEAKQEISYLHDLKEGISYIRQHEYVKRFFVFIAFFNLLASPVAFLTPLQVTRSYGDDVWRLTAIEIAFSLGMSIGGLIIATWGGFKNKVYTMTLSSVMMGFCTFIFGFTPFFFVYLLLMGVFGLTMPFFMTPSTVLFQEKVDGDFMGRVFGVLSMISSIMMPLGMLVFGPLSDTIKIEWLLLGTGILMMIEGIILRFNKVLVEAGKPVVK